jgi:hypothetical protein
MVKVLIISRSAWNDSRNDTLSNIFQKFNHKELANIYCREELPNNELCHQYFRITEGQLINNVFKRAPYAGEKLIFDIEKKNNYYTNRAAKEKFYYDYFRTKRLIVFLWLREILWALGKWKSDNLISFLKEFKPDVIFAEAYDVFYMYRLINFSKKITGCPLILYHADDRATLTRFSINPLFWVNRVILKLTVSKAIRKASINYCIIDKQKDVYTKIFGNRFKIINKSASFLEKPGFAEIQKPIHIVFAGNIIYGRWKTLTKVSRIINELNSDDCQVILDIYTGNPVPKKMKYELLKHKGVNLKGFVSKEKLLEIQKSADILLHVESLDLKEKLSTRLSFSTKLVDFFELGKCIIAIGWEQAASIDYLIKHNGAITITDVNKIKEELEKIITRPDLINKFAAGAYNLGKEYHNKQKKPLLFRKDIEQLKYK